MIVNSPLMSRMYQILDVRQASMVIRVIEILCGFLIATRPFAPRLSAFGSIGAIITFLITLTFVLTTPGVWQTVPALGLSNLPSNIHSRRTATRSHLVYGLTTDLTPHAMRRIL